MNRYRVVVQLNSEQTPVQKATLGQIQNMLKSGESIDIELVIHGAAADLLLPGAGQLAHMEDVHARGVRVLVCQNTLQARGWTPDDLPVWIEVVDSAVVHLIKRQHEGWAYLRN